MQGEALFDIRKRPSRMEKGVSLILENYYLYSCLALLCKLIAVFTPLSIRRGDGGEAVDGWGLGWLWLVGRPFVRLRKASSPQVLTRKTLLTVGDFLWSPSYHEASPFVSSIGTKVYDVVSTLDDVKVMFDD